MMSKRRISILLCFVLLATMLIPGDARAAGWFLEDREKEEDKITGFTLMSPGDLKLRCQATAKDFTSIGGIEYFDYCDQYNPSKGFDQYDEEGNEHSIPSWFYECMNDGTDCVTSVRDYGINIDEVDIKVEDKPFLSAQFPAKVEEVYVTNGAIVAWDEADIKAALKHKGFAYKDTAEALIDFYADLPSAKIYLRRKNHCPQCLVGELATNYLTEDEVREFKANPDSISKDVLDSFLEENKIKLTDEQYKLAQQEYIPQNTFCYVDRCWYEQEYNDSCGKLSIPSERVCGEKFKGYPLVVGEDYSDSRKSESDGELDCRGVHCGHIEALGECIDHKCGYCTAAFLEVLAAALPLKETQLQINEGKTVLDETVAVWSDKTLSKLGWYLFEKYDQDSGEDDSGWWHNERVLPVVSGKALDMTFSRPMMPGKAYRITIKDQQPIHDYCSCKFWDLETLYGKTEFLLCADEPKITMPKEDEPGYEKYRPTVVTSDAISLTDTEPGQLIKTSGGSVKLDWSSATIQNNGSPITGMYIEVSGTAIDTKPKTFRLMSLTPSPAYDPATRTLDAKKAANAGKIQVGEGVTVSDINVINLADTGLDNMSLSVYARNSMGYGSTPLYQISGIKHDMVVTPAAPTPAPAATPTPTPAPAATPTPTPTPAPATTPRPSTPSSSSSSSSSSSGGGGVATSTSTSTLTAPTVVWEEPNVIINHPDPSAKLWYELDGGKTTHYTKPVTVKDNGEHVVIANATKDGVKSPDVKLEFEYWGNPNQPVIDHDYTTAKVTITGPNDATIMYTLDNGKETEYKSPFTIDQSIDHVIKAWTVRKGKKSDTVSKDIYLKPSMPVITANDKGKVTITCATKDAEIVYATKNTWVTYKKPFTVKDGTTVKAYAVRKDIKSDEAKKLISFKYEKEIKVTPYMNIYKTVYKGAKFKVDMVNKNKTNKTTWTVKDDSVVKASKDGVSKGLKPGKTTVECVSTNNGKQYYKYNLIVTVPKAKGTNLNDTGVKNEKYKSKMPVLRMRKRLHPDSRVKFGLKNIKAADKITYTTSNAKVATINSKGIVTPKAKSGKCVVTATMKFHEQTYIYKMHIVIS